MLRATRPDPIFPGLFSYWVIPGQLVAGAHPGFTSSIDVPHVIASLIRAGAEVFLDLTEPGEALDYQLLLRGRRGRSGGALEYRQLGFEDMSVPSPEVMRDTLDLLDRAIDSHRIAYVHCYGGLGRTGTVIGCHLVRHGLPGPTALERLAELRGEAGEATSSSPVTDRQRRFVSDWRVGS